MSDLDHRFTLEQLNRRYGHQHCGVDVAELVLKLIYQHSDHERQKEVASGLDKMVRAARGKGSEQRKDGQGGAEVVRDA
ncbi:hypothetical protein [Streptomyces sp. NPDC056255]|uniref:hypothetical protein n=1 Tax=Streptomyces sp. NPDC056255 TaxID=3345764 RepID=UPI0035D616D1